MNTQQDSMGSRELDFASEERTRNEAVRAKAVSDGEMRRHGEREIDAHTGGGMRGGGALGGGVRQRQYALTGRAAW